MMKIGLALILGLMACQTYGQGPSQHNHERKKRLVFGKYVSKYRTYPVLNYQAAITNGIQPGLKNCWHLHSSRELPGQDDSTRLFTVFCQDRIDIKCGGSLITNSAVQTSCHCLTGQVLTTKRRLKVAKNIVSVWETYSIVHVGALRLIDMTQKTARFAKRYYIHEHCLPLIGQIWVYDFGLVIVDKRETDADGWPWRIAPLYMKADLTNIWQNATSHEWVCMHVGFGHTTYANGVYANRARSLLYSWRLIADRNWCSKFHRGVVSKQILSTDEYEPKKMSANYPLNLRPHYEELSRQDKYACSRHIGKFKEIPSYSDSGHAVSCSDLYFSVQGLSLAPSNWTSYGVAFSMPLVFDPYVNAAEYRRRFAEFVDKGSIHNLYRALVIQTNGSVPGYTPYQKPNFEREWSPDRGYFHKREVDQLEAMDYLKMAQEQTSSESIAIRLVFRLPFLIFMFSFNSLHYFHFF